MYAAFHPDFVAQQWHVFVSFLVITWVSYAIVLFANRILPFVESLGGFFTITGVFITIIVCTVMPVVKGQGHASHEFVWRDWVNSTGYSSNGFVFLLGMLNGAFAVGTPDITTHLAEEIPRYVLARVRVIHVPFVQPSHGNGTSKSWRPRWRRLMKDGPLRNSTHAAVD